MLGVLQYLAVVALLLWAFRRVFAKAGLAPGWAWLMAAPIVGLFTPLPVGLALLIGVPAVMIWVFAFVSWPSVDAPRAPAAGPGYAPPVPETFKGRFRRTAAPSERARRARRGIVREAPPPPTPEEGSEEGKDHE